MPDNKSINQIKNSVNLSSRLLHVEPVLQVFSHVVAKEWTHSHRIVHDRFSFKTHKSFHPSGHIKRSRQ